MDEPRPDARRFGHLPGKLAIGGLRLLGRHGVLPEELQRTQPFEVSLELDLDMAAAASSDRLTDTVDYAAVVEAARGVVEGGPALHLLEALSTRIATAVLAAAPHSSGVRVEIRKLRPPVPADLGWAGVAVYVGRPDLARRVLLSLGSNQGDRQAQIRTALESLGGRLVAVSPCYETEPLGGPPGQPLYLNVVAELLTSDTPGQLLELARRLESSAGRVRAERWGPRTLDVDVLWIDGEQVDQHDLQVPHPRMWNRRFVTVPLGDVAPELVAAHRPEHPHGEVRLVGSVWPDGRMERRRGSCSGTVSCD